jgi:hypothetical protein
VPEHTTTQCVRFVHFGAECCAPPPSIATINWEFLALLDCGTLTVTGQGVGVFEKRSNMSHLFWRRDLTRMRTSLCCVHWYLRPQNADLTDSTPHKW